MSFDREKANIELMHLCFPDGRWPTAEPKDFFAGLRLDGTCDQAKVAWALFGRLWCALSDRGFAVRLDDAEGYMDCEIVNADGELFYVEDGEQTAHPVLAFYLCIRAAGLLKGEADAD